jgi:hypothetical protein
MTSKDTRWTKTDRLLVKRIMPKQAWTRMVKKSKRLKPEVLEKVRLLRPFQKHSLKLVQERVLLLAQWQQL